ncbi:cytochrome b/b6 domain-containing protein [Limnoglobus roseus]|uniref:Thiosulfate reductase n=1 Tax=Limnoglobus roseus TaxID=2598579 RepID=A0A5C1AVJ7_9BACT|nr:cytochrome b/b6 domain-containing protein [Limnoglobus roseus]QEL20838.1 thiosulfate reductase [Limnoglobus roseus]
MLRLAHKHDRAIRYLHWVNVPLLAVMIWSGLLIYWAYDPYQIAVGNFVLVKFFPDWFYQALDLEHGLSTGMAFHFAFMWLFALNGLAFVAYTVWSGHWRELWPNRRTPIEALHVVLHDLKIRKQPLPLGKFNAAQKLAYCGVLLMGAGSVVTGLAIYKPTQLAGLTFLLGGYEATRLEHFALTVGYVLFVLVHVSQVIKAGWNNFRGMVTGYELVPTSNEVTTDVRPEPVAAS